MNHDNKCFKFWKLCCHGCLDSLLWSLCFDIVGLKLLAWLLGYCFQSSRHTGVKECHAFPELFKASEAFLFESCLVNPSHRCYSLCSDASFMTDITLLWWMFFLCFTVHNKRKSPPVTWIRILEGHLERKEGAQSNVWKPCLSGAGWSHPVAENKLDATMVCSFSGTQKSWAFFNQDMIILKSHHSQLQ